MSNMINEGLKTFGGLLILGMVINLIVRIRKKKSKIGTIISTIVSVVAICICYFATEYVSGVSTQVISCVKERIPEGYKISYGQALDEFLSNEEWSYFKSKDEPYNIVVQVKGNCKYEDSDAEMIMQFVFSSDIGQADQVTKDSEFKIGYIGKNGSACSDTERISFFNDVFAEKSDETVDLQDNNDSAEPIETLSPEEDRLINSDKYFNQQRVDDVSYVGNSNEGEIVVTFSVMNDTPYLNITDNGKTILEYAEANFVDEDSIAYSNDDGTGGLLFTWENENLVDLANAETGAEIQLYREAG